MKKVVKYTSIIILGLFALSWGYWEYLGYRFEQDPLFYYKPRKCMDLDSETPPVIDKRSGDFCPMCQSRNVANIVYGYPAKGWGALAEDKKSSFHGCVLPMNPKKYHCNDCKYDWGSFRKRTKRTDKIYKEIVRLLKNNHIAIIDSRSGIKVDEYYNWMYSDKLQKKGGKYDE